MTMDPTLVLALVFDRFARWQALRAVLQRATFGMMLCAVARSANTAARGAGRTHV